MPSLLSAISRNRKLWAAVLVVGILFAAIPQIANAQFTGPAPGPSAAADQVEEVAGELFTIGGFTQNVISGLMFGISWLLALLAGVVIGAEVWFLQVIFSINAGLINGAPVKIGFPIVLAIANLFFVGALIAIAIATITQQEEYGMKKALWKLVLMAVMVNFGLVICGTLLSISDEATKYFIESINNDQPSADGDVDYFKFADSIAGAFNPMGMFTSMDEVRENPALAKESLGAAAKNGDAIGEVIKPIVGVLAALASFVIIIVTLGTMIGMLLWRYVKLGIALIILPLAWAAYIFPTYHEHYKSWWTKFTKWAIFPPVMVFFIWLSLKISEVMAAQDGEFVPLHQTDNPIGTFMGNILAPVIGQTLKALILWGIMMGGLVAAQELGVKFADAGYKAIEGAGGWAKDRAMNYAKRGARNRYQAGLGGKFTGRELNTRLANNKWGQQMTGWKRAVVTTIGSGASLLGKGLEDVTQKGGAEVAKSYEHDIPHDTEGKLNWIQGNHNLPSILQALSSMNAGDISRIKNIGGKSLAEWLQENHQKIVDYAQHDLEKTFKDMGVGGDHGIDTGLLKELTEEAPNLAVLKPKVAAMMKRGDPAALSKLLKDGGGIGLKEKQALALHQAMMWGVGKAFSPEDFATFAEGWGTGQVKNFTAGTEAALKEQGATPNEIFGDDNADLMRKNGAIRSRGPKSELWGEAGKPETVSNIARRGKSNKEKKEDRRRKKEEKEKTKSTPPQATTPHLETGGGDTGHAGPGAHH